MGYMRHRNSRQRKLLDSTAVAENRITGGVGGVTGEIPLLRPDPGVIIAINTFPFSKLAAGNASPR